MAEKQNSSFYQAERYRPQGVEGDVHKEFGVLENKSPSILESSFGIKENTINVGGKKDGIVKRAFSRAESSLLRKAGGDNMEERSAVLAAKYTYKTGKYAALAGKTVGGGIVRTGAAMTIFKGKYGGSAKSALSIKGKSGIISTRQSVKKVIKTEIKAAIREFRGSDDLGMQAIVKTKDAILKAQNTGRTLKTTSKAVKKTVKGTYKVTKATLKTSFRITKAAVKTTIKVVKLAVQSIAKLIALIASNPITLLIFVISIIVVVVCAIVSSIIPAISLKSEDKELARTYQWVTQLDADFVAKIQDINREDHPLLYINIDEFHYFLDGTEIDLDDLKIQTNADYILMYLDCKYEDYALDKFIYGLFGGTNVKDEVRALHNTLYTYDKNEWDESREHTIIDEEGNETTEIENIHRLDVSISTISFEDYIADNWESLINDQEKELFDLLMEVGCYTTRVELGNPFEDIDDGSYYISSRWGYRFHPISGKLKMHNGIDIPKPSGTPINNVLPGKVIEVGNDAEGWGIYVRVENDAGTRDVLYAHLSSALVTQGEALSKGDIIGYVGSTGAATGPHLHLEYNIEKGFFDQDGFNTNPAFYLKGCAYTGN